MIEMVEWFEVLTMSQSNVDENKVRLRAYVTKVSGIFVCCGLRHIYPRMGE